MLTDTPAGLDAGLFDLSATQEAKPAAPQVSPIALDAAATKAQLVKAARLLGWTGNEALHSKGDMLQWMTAAASARPGDVLSALAAQGVTLDGTAPQEAPKPRPAGEKPRQPAGDQTGIAEAIGRALAPVFAQLAAAQATQVDPEQVRSIAAEVMEEGAAEIRANNAMTIGTALEVMQKATDTAAEFLKAEVDKLDARLTEALKARPRPIVLNINGMKRAEISERQHHKFPVLLRAIAAKRNVWLAGPAGSGKTTAARNVAKALGLPFYFLGAVGAEHKVNGYVDAHGKIVSTPFRQAWTHGGLVLLDECDGSNAAALLAINAALAGDLADFPGEAEPTPKHPDCFVIAAGNTYGAGATLEYVGRAKLDGAFLDRFVFMTWGYDEAIEDAAAGNPEWTARVRMYRKAAADRGAKVLITPRASINGAALIAAGCSVKEAEALTILDRLPADLRKQLVDAVREIERGAGATPDPEQTRRDAQ